MPSSKLSGRRTTARKPSVCLSKPPGWPNVAWVTPLSIQWVPQPPQTYPVALYKEITPTQDKANPNTWQFLDPSATPPAITKLTITIPGTPAAAHCEAEMLDTLLVTHEARTDFPNPGPPPNNFTISTWDWLSHPGDALAVTNPV